MQIFTKRVDHMQQATSFLRIGLRGSNAIDSYLYLYQMITALVNVNEYKLLTCEITDVNEAQVYDQLSESEQARIKKYLHPQDRLQRMAGLFLVRELIHLFHLQEHLSLSTLHRNKHNKPTFNHALNFSLAHTHNRVVCMGSVIKKVGIDIERIKEIDTNLLSHYLTNKEQQTLKQTADDSLQFLTLWTRKEAIAKASSLGIMMPFEQIEVIDDDVFFQTQQYALHTFLHDGFVISYAVCDL
jgi:4'-phosphopantetheinyl transferase